MVKRTATTPGRMAGSSKRMRTTPTAKTAIRKIARDVVLRMAEKKVYRKQASEQAINSAIVADQWSQLSNVPQGIGHSDRTGQEIRLQRLTIKGLLHNNSTGTHIVRMVVGYFNDQTAMGTTTELFEAAANNGGPLTGGTITGADGVTALLLPFNRAKFTPLVDRLIKLGANASVDAAQVRTFSVNIPLKDRKIHFEAGTAGGNNQDRHLYLGFWTAEGGNDTGVGTITEASYVTSLYYTDM